jgi:hypothetical protein
MQERLWIAVTVPLSIDAIEFQELTGGSAEVLTS